MQNNGEENRHRRGRYAEQWTKEHAERRPICRTIESEKTERKMICKTMKKQTSKKEDDIQNSGEENRQKGS